jgi:hypothetical protein
MNNRSIQCEQCETTDNVMTVDNKADEEDRDIQTYISTMQSKYNLCQLCAMSEFFKRCPGCNVDMGSRQLCGMCKQWDGDEGDSKPYDGRPN